MGRRMGLRVEVEDADTFSVAGQGRGQVDGRRRLAHPALLVDDGDPTQAASPSVEVGRRNIAAAAAVNRSSGRGRLSSSSNLRQTAGLLLASPATGEKIILPGFSPLFVRKDWAMFTRLRLLAAVTALAFVPAVLADETATGLKKGTPPLKQAGPMTFGPDGVLFVADAPAATIYAISTGDTKPADVKSLSVAKIDEAIGGMLGTTGSDVVINDMKVNPLSGNVYLSVARGKGPTAAPVIVKVGGDGKAAELPLKDVMFASVKLDNEAKNPKNPAITSIAFHKGELFVAGMTTDAWEANLKTIAFPFSESAT